jgi:amino acid adenylation domain-containing protein
MDVIWMADEVPSGESGGALGDAAPLPPTPLSYTRDPDQPCYVLFTSGSTGAPKGVVITHANVVAFIEWATRYFRIGPHDRLSGHSPLHFDLSAFDVFGAFAAGAELHLVPTELNVLPNKLAEFIRERELTQWFSVPSVLSYMKRFDVGRPGDFPMLRRLLWCGEVFPTPALRYWMKLLPHVEFTNLYGPTEATIASSYYTVAISPESEVDDVPIGLPCDGEHLHVLDGDLHAVPAGELGDLYIEGAGLSPGYWDDPNRTGEAFLDWRDGSGRSTRIYRTGDLARIDAGGLAWFAGRRDSQIKSRGYRIELGEIEAAVNALDLVGEGIVLALNLDGFEGATICCAYALEPGESVTPADLRKLLEPRLPGYMMPARWVEYTDFPRNANGKIDRRELREQFAGQAVGSGDIPLDRRAP